MPPLILDADSSQHSAIVDAMAGRSMVIEGPPGTGKSQTIANLIAAALGEGKSVLFVADKLTALEVVRKRLDEHGIGVFCLELHSDKTQKARLMEDLRQRLALQGTFRPPPGLGARREALEAARERLNAYADLMKRPFGALDLTIHDVLWGAQRRRSSLGGEARRWGVIELGNVQTLRRQEYEEICRTAGTFGTALGQLRKRGLLNEHPFWGRG